MFHPIFKNVYRAERLVTGVFTEHLHEVTPGNAEDCGKDSEQKEEENEEVKRQIFVRTLTGKTVTVDVSDTDSVADLKAAVRAKTGGRRDVHRLTINGRDMSDKESLRMCRTHCNVWELGRLRGGSSGGAPEAMDDAPTFTFEIPDSTTTHTTTQLFDLRPVPPPATKQDCIAALKAMKWEGARVVTLLSKGRTGEKTLVVRAETQPPHSSVKWQSLVVSILPAVARDTSTVTTTADTHQQLPTRVPDPTERNRKVKYTSQEFVAEYGADRGKKLFEQGQKLELAWMQRVVQHQLPQQHQNHNATPADLTSITTPLLQMGKGIEALLERQVLQLSKMDSHATRAEELATNAEAQREQILSAVVSNNKAQEEMNAALATVVARQCAAEARQEATDAHLAHLLRLLQPTTNAEPAHPPSPLQQQQSTTEDTKDCDVKANETVKPKTATETLSPPTTPNKQKGSKSSGAGKGSTMDDIFGSGPPQRKKGKSKDGGKMGKGAGKVTEGTEEMERWKKESKAIADEINDLLFV